MSKIDREAQSRDYFRSVVKEAIKDLKKGREAYVFSLEQLQAVKDIINRSSNLSSLIKNVTVLNDDGFYYIRTCK